jgi:hypothetical protein
MESHMDTADLILCRMTLRHMGDTETVPAKAITEVSQLHKGEVGMSFCVRTEIARELRFVNEFEYGRGEDWQFVQRVIEKGLRVKLLSDILYHVKPSND